MYWFIHISMNQINRRSIIGEISKAPRLGKNLLIRFKIGSVKRYVNSNIEYSKTKPYSLKIKQDKHKKYYIKLLITNRILHLVKLKYNDL